MSARDDRAALRAALAALPPRPRAVFILHAAHGRGHGEIARRLEIDIATVERELAFALSRLAHAMDQAGDQAGDRAGDRADPPS